MTSQPEFDATKTADSLHTSLVALEAALHPLLSVSWADTLAPLSPLERAKMDVMAAYTIVDLMWVYLRMTGVDPAGHEVSTELERVRKYYAKIKAIESPETRRQKVDADAAGRFIKHAIPAKQRLPGIATGHTSAADLPSTSAAAAAQSSRRAAGAVAVVEGAEAGEGQFWSGLDRRWRFVAASAERVELGAGAGAEDDEGHEEAGDHGASDEDGGSEDEEEDLDDVEESARGSDGDGNAREEDMPHDESEEESEPVEDREPVDPASQRIRGGNEADMLLSEVQSRILSAGKRKRAGDEP